MSLSHEFRCIVCESAEKEEVITKGGFSIIRCRNCGLFCVDPLPTEKEIFSHYSFDSNYHVDIVNEKKQSKVADRGKRRLDVLRRAGINGKKILDVGCSAGVFLNVAKESGFDPHGVEVNRDTCELARNRFDLDVRNCKVEELAEKDEHFDIITFLDSLEHMRDPESALEAANVLLADDGYLLVTLPNVNGLFPALTYGLFAKRLRIWSHPCPPEHLYEFSPKTMSLLLEKTGFEVVMMEFEGLPIRYTTSMLTQSIISRLRDRNRPGRHEKGAEISEKKTGKAETGGNRTKGRVLRTVARKAMSFASYSFVLPVYLSARILNRGDQMVVLAKKKRTVTPGKLHAPARMSVGGSRAVH